MTLYYSIDARYAVEMTIDPFALVIDLRQPVEVMIDCLEY